MTAAFGKSIAAVFLAAVAFALPGCRQNDSDSGGDVRGGAASVPGLSETDLINPVGTLKLAIRERRWEKAWTVTGYLLREDSGAASEENGPSPSFEADTWALMGRAAHETGHLQEAAEYLCRACEVESFATPMRVRQAVIALVGVGRFYDGLAFLERAIAAQPDQTENRRWLFDLYAGADDRISAIPHGKQLIRSRLFDVELLVTLSNTEMRRLEADPLEEMVQRNPDDLRPRLGTAKSEFDDGDYDEAIKILREITSKHPDYHPAQAILGQALAADGRSGEVEQWAAEQTAGIEDYPGYWIAIGDWARGRGDLESALRAFGQATQCPDPDVVQVWTRLATLLPQINGSKQQIPEATVQAVNERAKQLSRFRQLKDRFERTGKISRAIALDIAQTLQQLGRLWESEAWASIAMTLAEDDAVDVAGFRKELLSELSAETPWQVRQGHPEFAPFYVKFPMPEIEKVVSSSRPERNAPVDASDSPRMTAGEVMPSWKMSDQAEARHLRYFGRTSDTLDQPGIMLYETLGCGGGTIDFDRDGWEDLYLVAAGGTPPAADSEPNELFRNVDGDFQPVAASAGIDDRGFGQGVAVGDANEDGFPDLLVLNYGPNRLYINNGDGTFRDASGLMASGPADEWSSSGAIADVDGDGLSDLVIVNYCEGLEPVTRTCPMKGTDQLRSCTPVLFAGAADRFLANDGSGGYPDATTRWNAKPDRNGRGLGIVIGNMDGNQGNEIFIANDMTNNHYYSRVPTESFALAESAMVRGIGADDRGIAQGSMGIATGDLDRDGDFDLYVTNFNGEYNTLHLQASSGIWRDRTAAENLTRPTIPLVGFGTEAIDMDNDGDLELVITNGHVDLFSRGDEIAMYDQPLQLFRRAGSQGYQSVDVDSLGDYFAKRHVGRSLWTIDANRDGQVDLAVTHQTEPVALLINETESNANWIRLELHGRRSSRDAIGSVVSVQTTDGPHLAFRVSGDGYQCSNESILQLGLGDAADERVDISVTWPDGITENFSEIPTRTQTSLVQQAR
ncbi:FG-GAP-like repeat-containing protein [Roseiconus nitratireducens]|nr:FG-GAP-like repeat-containing protein [Roseiconus nitratireducens]